MAKKEELIKDEDLQDDVVLESAEEVVSEDDNLEEMELDTKDSGSDAAATLKPNSKPAGKSKSEYMAGAMKAMGDMSYGDMVKFFELSMAQAANAADSIKPGQADANKASIAAKGKPVAEDLAAIFGADEELSEELQEKMSTLFEAAVSSHLAVEKARLEEEFDAELKERVEEISSDLQEKVDKYLDYVAQNWLEENKVAVEGSLRSELVESFINDLGQLCKTYNLDLPEGQDDVVSTLVARVDELEEALNSSEKEKMGLSESVLELQKEVIVESIADELSPIHYKKFKTLAENVEYDGDEAKFAKKLSYIKEGFFESKPKTASTNLINEDLIAEETGEPEDKPYVDPAVKRIHDAISRTAKL